MSLATKAASASAAWSLDTTSWLDQVGSNNLTGNGSTTITAGKFGNGALFVRSNATDFLSLADVAAVSTGDIDFMIRCWVQLNTVDANSQLIIAKDDNTLGREYFLHYNASGNGYFGFSVSGGVASVYAVAFGTPSTGTPYLIHAWHDAANDLLGIAVNTTADTAATSGTAPSDTTAPFNIGRRSYSGFEDYMDGWVDDVVILKNAFLDGTERTEDYNSGTGIAFANWTGGGNATTHRLRTPAAAGTIWRLAPA